MVVLFGLLLKILMTASIVVIASVVVERSGPMIGAMIASLPTAGGAAYIILAWEHPPSFIALSATGGMISNIGVIVLAVVFATTAKRWTLIPALGAGYFAWFCVIVVAKIHDWNMPTAIACTIPIFAGAVVVSRRLQLAAERRRLKVSALDIAGRGALVAAFVTTITAFSHAFGSFLAGVFAFFPIALSSFLIILYRRVGASAASSVAAHMAVPLLGLSFAQVEIHYLAERIGVWWSYLLALAICAVWALCSLGAPRLFVRFGCEESHG